MNEFKIIKNSESQTGYNVEDKEFKGYIDGLCCGWQYECTNDKGELKYGSVVWLESYETFEDYANRWTNDNGKSWLLDMWDEGWDFTGRVIFRGYARSYYDPVDRETYVEPLEEV